MCATPRPHARALERCGLRVVSRACGISRGTFLMMRCCHQTQRGRPHSPSSSSHAEADRPRSGSASTTHAEAASHPAALKLCTRGQIRYRRPHAHGAAAGQRASGARTIVCSSQSESPPGQQRRSAPCDRLPAGRLMSELQIFRASASGPQCQFEVVLLSWTPSPSRPACYDGVTPSCGRRRGCQCWTTGLSLLPGRSCTGKACLFLKGCS